MAKFVFLLLLAYITYVSAFPSEEIVGNIPPKRRHPRAAYPHHHPDHHEHVIPEIHDDHHHDHHHDDDHHHDHYDHAHSHTHVLSDPHYGHHDHDHDIHYNHPHNHDDIHVHYDGHDHHDHHDHHDVHGYHDIHDVHSHHDHHHERPGYDEIHIYIDDSKTHSKNSQASLIEAALVHIEDDAELRKVISDIIFSELQDQKTLVHRYPQVVVDNKSPSDPVSTLPSEFIRRK